MNFIKKWLVRRALKAKQRSAASEKNVFDDILADEIKRLTDVNRTADKLLKAKLIRQQSEATLSKIRDLDEELEDEGSDDSPQSMEDQIGQMLIGKLLGGGLQNNTAATGSGGFGDLEVKAQEAGVTPDQIEKFKEKMGI